MLSIRQDWQGFKSLQVHDDRLVDLLPQMRPAHGSKKEVSIC